MLVTFYSKFIVNSISNIMASGTISTTFISFILLLIIRNAAKYIIAVIVVTDALSTMLRLLGEESEEASWLIQVWSRMDPVEPCDKE